ncbi:hypothetical protein GCM10020367_51970 [Streptomyces sannanensis]|uniref:Uncharacterized protein n=1 Tax=Streptomyces sannanensis TaxID=285536 RepID=A0ABP6SI91_9ACTN
MGEIEPAHDLGGAARDGLALLVRLLLRGPRAVRYVAWGTEAPGGGPAEV